MQKREQTKVEKIAARGYKRLDDYYNKKIKKSKYNNIPDYVREVRYNDPSKT
ncbi:MAG: hypothetical protein PHF86_08670 [Candidatus Nanoarchaeia archaeon]|jgi:hypothetical protein|nr:hypothetical protein [Candidatus Nanoarchaeia archaeon]